MQLLDYGLAGGASARQVLEQHSPASPLAADWRLLAYYSWATDDEQLVPEKDVAGHAVEARTQLPARPARVGIAPGAASSRRSRYAKADAKPTIDKADALASVRACWRVPELVREHYDQLAFSGDDIVGAITAPSSAERTQLVKTWNAGARSDWRRIQP